MRVYLVIAYRGERPWHIAEKQSLDAAIAYAARLIPNYDYVEIIRRQDDVETVVARWALYLDALDPARQPERPRQ